LEQFFVDLGAKLKHAAALIEESRREPAACFRDIKEKHQRFPERPWPRGLEASGGPKISLFVCQCGCTQQSLFIVL